MCILKLLPLQGAGRNVVYTQGVALGLELLPFQGVWGNGFCFLLCFCFKNYLKIRVVSLSLSNSSWATA